MTEQTIKGLCIDCKILKKDYPKHRCYWCALKKEAPDEQIRLALERRTAADPSAPRTRPGADWPPGLRWCGGCRAYVGLRYVSGARCRGCALVDRRKAEWALDEQQQAALLKLSGGKCMGCLRSQRFKTLAIEHNHTTNEIRGIMEQECNSAIGIFHDDPLRFLRIAIYLVAPPANGVINSHEPMTDRQIAEAILDLTKIVLAERRSVTKPADSRGDREIAQGDIR